MIEKEVRKLVGEARTPDDIIIRLTRAFNAGTLNREVEQILRLMPEYKPATTPPVDVSAATLLAKAIAPLRQAIPGLLPEGLGLLAAPPKAGKSFLTMQVAVEVALGGQVLGIGADQRDVLYYPLEDGERRVQERLAFMLAGRQPPSRLTFRWTAPRLGGPLEDEVSTWLDKHPRGVAGIDVLSKVRPDAAIKGKSAYDADYDALGGLHDVAKHHPGSLVLVVTHDRKAGSDDWVTRVTGTRGVTGAADFVIFIDRKRSEQVGDIRVTGRDIEDRIFRVTFNGRWELATIEQVMTTISDTRQAIFGWLRDHGPAWPKAIADATGLSHAAVRNRLGDMVTDEQLVNGPDGYDVPREEVA